VRGTQTAMIMQSLTASGGQEYGGTLLFVFATAQYSNLAITSTRNPHSRFNALRSCYLFGAPSSGWSAGSGSSRHNALTKRAADLDFPHISDYRLDDPRNDGLSKPALESDLPRRNLYELAKQVAAGGAPPPRPAPIDPSHNNNGRPANHLDQVDPT
jgi:hypothetical protein